MNLDVASRVDAICDAFERHRTSATEEQTPFGY